MPPGQADLLGCWGLELLSCAAPAFEGKCYLLTQGWSGPRALEVLAPSACSLHVKSGPCGVGKSCPPELPRAQLLADHSWTQHSRIFRLVEGIHPWKHPEAICAPWTSRGTPALLSLSCWVSALPLGARVIHLGICRGMGSGSRKQIHLQSVGVMSFSGGFTLCTSSQHMVPHGARWALLGGTTSPFPPSLLPPLPLCPQEPHASQEMGY